MACAKKNVRCASTRKEMERKTENHAERLEKVLLDPIFILK